MRDEWQPMSQMGPRRKEDLGVLLCSCPRMAVHRLTMSPLNKQLDLLDAGVYAGAERVEHFGPEEQQNLARMDMLEQTKYKYTLNLDGLSAAGR